MAKQARCPKCHIHFQWKKDYWFWEGLTCPVCKEEPLVQTTRLCKDPKSEKMPIVWAKYNFVSLPNHS